MWNGLRLYFKQKYKKGNTEIGNHAGFQGYAINFEWRNWNAGAEVYDYILTE